MAASFLLSHAVSDLCIGRPRVVTLPPSAPVAAVLAALRAGADPFIFVDADGPATRASKRPATATVYAKVSVADVLCYVCGDTGSLRDPAAALARPVSAVTADGGVAHRVDPRTSLLDAIDTLLTSGCHGLLVPLQPRSRRKDYHRLPSSPDGPDCCVLTREDIVRHLFGSVSRFSTVAALSVTSLGLVRRDVHAVHVRGEGLDAVPLLRRAVADGTAVAVVADEGALVGEICPGVLGSCDVGSVSAAFAALSVGDAMTYIDCSLSHAPPEFLLRAVRAQLKNRGLDAMSGLVDAGDAACLPLSPTSSSSASSDEDHSPLGRARRPRKVSSGSLGCRSTEDVVACHAGSSLVAVTAQALAHRVGHVWVVDEASGALVGVVTFAGVLAVLREHIRAQVLLST